MVDRLQLKLTKMLIHSEIAKMKVTHLLFILLGAVAHYHARIRSIINISFFLTVMQKSTGRQVYSQPSVLIEELSYRLTSVKSPSRTQGLDALGSKQFSRERMKTMFAQDGCTYTIMKR